MNGDVRMLLLILAMGIVTYISRRAFLTLPASFFTARLKNGLDMIPLGIFAALIFPSLFVKGGEWTINPLYAAASVVCVLVMLRWRNVFLGFGISLLLVLVVKALAAV
ncbi:AzlD domain-containing protein [Brevibacillus borstelensis]|uniref:AzlD domain-containing protein n=1 Tax=Brevibacillus borstelensis TaxID=45462 RepID=UPI0030BDB306